jgi:hypothetical protein
MSFSSIRSLLAGTILACSCGAARAADYKIRFDTAQAPQLAAWTTGELAPIVRDWYPKLVALLADEGFAAPHEVVIEYKADLGPVPAYTAGNRITLNARWFAGELQREAKGCVIHELVHVVQQYGANPFKNPKPAPAPGWVVEGIADYVRWFLYEPATKGAALASPERARHDASYRVSANFLEWVAARHDKDVVKKLNSAARRGTYDDALWKGWTGTDLATLAAGWKRDVAAGLR